MREQCPPLGSGGRGATVAVPRAKNTTRRALGLARPAIPLAAGAEAAGTPVAPLSQRRSPRGVTSAGD